MTAPTPRLGGGRPGDDRRCDPTDATRRSLLLGALAAWAGFAGCGWVVGTESAMAAGDLRLYMLEDPGCPYCARWTAEIEPAFANSAEAQFAPIVRMLRTEPRAHRFAGVAYSPTFILADEQREFGRLIGYSGPDFYWPMLDSLLAKAGFQAPAL
jgi:hypothetical protein